MYLWLFQHPMYWSYVQAVQNLLESSIKLPIILKTAFAPNATNRLKDNMKRLKELYTTEIAPKIAKEFKLSNINMVPKIQKISVNIGVGRSKEHPEILTKVANDLYRITGQMPRITKSKKAISGFKLRTGDIVGINMTLRGNTMYDFLEKLLNVGLPRVRDFRGLSMESFDKNFNYTYAIKEHIIFPEITYERIEDIYGFQVSFHIKSNKKEEAIALLKELGFPFKK